MCLCSIFVDQKYFRVGNAQKDQMRDVGVLCEIQIF